MIYEQWTNSLIIPTSNDARDCRLVIPRSTIHGVCGSTTFNYIHTVYDKVYILVLMVQIYIHNNQEDVWKQKYLKLFTVQYKM